MDKRFSQINLLLKSQLKLVWVLVKVLQNIGLQLLNQAECYSKLTVVNEETAREAMRLAAHKLPVKTKFVKKSDFEEVGGEINEG